MDPFWTGFIGAWVGSATVATVILGLYLWEVKQRAKAAKILGDELKSILYERTSGLREQQSYEKGNKFN